MCNYSAADSGAIARELEALGARVLPRYERGAVTHLVTPYARGAAFEAACADGAAVVTYAWLEDCLAARRLLPRDARVLYAPIRDAAGVPGLARCVLACCGYAGAARAELRELADAAGCAFSSGGVSAHTTHLLAYRPEGEAFAAALLARLEGRDVAVVNHRWLQDCVRAWRRLPESAPAYTRLGAEVDADARCEVAQQAQAQAEARARAAERRAAALEAALEAEAGARQAAGGAAEEARHREAAASAALADAAAARGADAVREASARDDAAALRGALAAADAARAQMAAQLAAADEERRGAAAALDAAAAQQRQLAAAFARSRGDLLAQLEARLAAMGALSAALEAEQARHAETSAALAAARREAAQAADVAASESSRAAASAEAAASASRDRAALGKQLEAERRSRLAALSDFETERRQREQLGRQLAAEASLRASLQAAVAAKDGLRAAAEVELQRARAEAASATADAASARAQAGTRPGAPRPADAAAPRVPAKLFLDGGADVRVLELEPDATLDALMTSVAAALADSLRVAYEDGDGHRVALRQQADLDIALRAFDRAGSSYFKLVATRGLPDAEAAPTKRRGLLRWPRGKGDAADGEDGTDDAASGAGTARR